MADTNRDVTKEEIETMAAKLGPAVESLTEGEREVFELILERAGTAGAEVGGFGKHVETHQKTKLGPASSSWANPLAAQLAGAAGLGAPIKFADKKWT